MNEELLNAFDQTEYPAGTASDISDIVGLSRQGTRRRLEKLEENGDLERAKLNSGIVVYWRENA